MEINEITDAIIGAAIEVHRALGPGLLESTYQRCLGHELTLRKISFAKEIDLPVLYKGLALDCGYRLDLIVLNAVVVEVKSVQGLDRIHDAQMLTYLKLGGFRAGLLINFNVPLLKYGIRREVLGLPE